MDPAPAPDDPREDVCEPDALAGWPRCAYDLRATRRRVQATLVLAAFGVAVGVALLVASGVAWSSQRTLVSLDHPGARTPATVTAVASRVVARERHVIGSITVSFTQGTTPREHTFFVNNNVTRYQVGQPVQVAYDPADAAQVHLVGDDAASQGKVPWEVIGGVGLLVIGLAGIGAKHVLGARRILRAHEWVAVPAALRSTPKGLRSRGGSVVELGEARSPERIVAEAVTVRALPANIGPVAWVAGWGEKRLVVAPAGGCPALLVRVLSDLGADAPITPEAGTLRERGQTRG